MKLIRSEKIIAMETQNNVQKNWLTREQKAELILQWQQSGMTRKKFCQERSFNYYTFGTWVDQLKEKKKPSSGFKEVKLQSASSVFAQVHLPGGIKIDFYQSVPVEYFQSLIGK
jgi:hypothetical protein